MAVVKADGYGHGAARVAHGRAGCGAAELGVATVDEALALRADGITAPVLAWLHPPGIDFAPALAGRSRRSRCPRCANSTSCSTRPSAPAGRRRSRSRSTPGSTATVSSAAEYPGDADRAAAGGGRRGHPAARADVASGLRRPSRQPDQRSSGAAVRRYAGTRPASQRDRNSRWRTCRIRPATMSRPDLAFDMVRPGIAVYGLSPDPRARRHGAATGDDAEMPCCTW